MKKKKKGNKNTFEKTKKNAAFEGEELDKVENDENEQQCDLC